MANVTEIASKIRADLKLLGITSRQVSVKSESFSMGSAIRIVIRDLEVPHSVVKAVCDHHNAESIRYCQHSGEILSGGNRYLTVEFDRDSMNELDIPESVTEGEFLFKGHKIVPLDGDISCKVCVVGPDGHIIQGMRSYSPHAAAENILSTL